MALPPEEKRPDWHALPSCEVLERQGVDPRGLSEADAAARLQRFGPNAIPEPPQRGFLARVLAQLNNVLIQVLIVAGIITALMNHWTDAAVVFAVVILNAAIGLWQEGRAESALAAVRSMLSVSASVRRDGVRHKVAAEDLVPGDIVLLEAGDRVPADLRLIEARALKAQEAALTGESVPVDKDSAAVARQAPLGDRTAMAYSGTLVTAGRGIGVVVATGTEAEIGRIGTMLGSIEETKTPLLRQMDRFARLLTFAILALCVVVFGVGVLHYARDVEETFLAIVGLAVAAIPEGLPAVLTITLAIGVQRMAARHAIIRRLPAVETLGAVSVICTDKTGTLTLNEMVVRRLVTDPTAAAIEVSGLGYAPEGRLHRAEAPLPETEAKAARQLALAGLLCNDARLLHRDGSWQVAGDPMEGALLALAMRAGLDTAEEHARTIRRDDIPFDGAHRLMAVLCEVDHRRTIYVKGAPDRLIEMCDRQLDAGGTAPIDRKAWTARMEDLANSGHRVLAFAEKQADGADGLTMADLGGMTLLGLAGFIDPARPEAVAAVADCRRAGIAVKMITGDHALTALAVGRELGLDTDGGALTGAEIAALDDDALCRSLGDVTVFARAAPEQKLRLVEALQAGGGVVAMTGDGVNDAPALKRADVGVAMGIKGTEAAKEAARVVLADDNFASIVAAVREGRTINDNIRKVIAWNLPTNGGETLVIVAAILFGLTLPISPVQILWINMITAVALGLTLSFEPPEPGVMQRPPRRPDAGLLDGEMLWRVLLVSVLIAWAAFALFHWSAARGDPLELSRTLVVNLIVVMEIAYLFSVRYLHLTSFTLTGVLGTPAVLTGVALSVTAQAIFTYVPLFQTVFASRPVGLGDGLLILATGAVLLVVLEIEKWIRRGISRR